MRNTKGLSTVTQGGEERAIKIAAKHTTTRVRAAFKPILGVNHTDLCLIKKDTNQVYLLVVAAAFVPSSFTMILDFCRALDTYTGSVPGRTTAVQLTSK